MIKLIDYVMKNYNMPYVITTKEKLNQINDKKILDKKDFDVNVLHVTNFDEIISTSALMKLDVVDQVPVKDTEGNDVVVCSIEDTSENRGLIELAKKEQIEYNEMLVGEPVEI